ncbi:MAG: B12-binding domain-containing radical SAM protein [Candidatus Hodarchaeota archaeon]
MTLKKESEKLKILLLSVSSESFFYDQLVIPFGLISLASYIEDQQFEIKGIEMNNPPEKINQRYLQVDKEFLKEIEEFSPDIIAMSSYASNIYNIIFWANLLKKKLPNCVIMVGGNHASYIDKEILEKCPGIDIVVRFEGEIPFKMISEKLLNNNDNFSDVPSITYRSNGEIKKNPQAELIKDLSSLPMLNRDYFKFETKSKDEVYHADLISARGCPFNCTFCNCNHYWSKRYRVRHIDSIIKELKSLKEEYPNLKSIRIRDESVTINKVRCKKLCDAIKENGLVLEFQAHSRLDGLDEEVIQNLSEAGFKLVFIGMESGSQRILNILNKGIDISRAGDVVSQLRDYGIKFRISFMSETPDEKLKDVKKTIKLIKKLRLNVKTNEYYIGTGVAIYPGTTDCQKFLRLNPDYEWITKDYRFKGKYYPTRDSSGNIIQPNYLEHSRFKRAFIRIYIEISLNPIGLISYVKNSLKFIIQNIKLKFK